MSSDMKTTKNILLLKCAPTTVLCHSDATSTRNSTYSNITVLNGIRNLTKLFGRPASGMQGIEFERSRYPCCTMELDIGNVLTPLTTDSRPANASNKLARTRGELRDSDQPTHAARPHLAICGGDIRQQTSELYKIHKTLNHCQG